MQQQEPNVSVPLDEWLALQERVDQLESLVKRLESQSEATNKLQNEQIEKLNSDRTKLRSELSVRQRVLIAAAITMAILPLSFNPKVAFVSGELDLSIEQKEMPLPITFAYVAAIVLCLLDKELSLSVIDFVLRTKLGKASS